MVEAFIYVVFGGSQINAYIVLPDTRCWYESDTTRKI